MTPAADEDTQRTERRKSLRVLINRANNSIKLTTDEAQLLARHVATEICNANRAEQAEDLLRVAHETSNRSEAERTRAVQRAERAEAAIARVRKACASVQAADQGHNPAVNWVAMRVLEAIDARLVNGAEPASSSPCAGFPDQCPNLQPVPALSPYHGGGIRCGCTTPKES